MRDETKKHCGWRARRALAIAATTMRYGNIAVAVRRTNALPVKLQVNTEASYHAYVQVTQKLDIILPTIAGALIILGIGLRSGLGDRHGERCGSVPEAVKNDRIRLFEHHFEY
ncbi:hypothetical protein EVAR_61299_1 [Eumeta japonica]|uniref:Uncharacterized protein n=1 Tax=Eumeta variegata TaxID=151549 RepID=A0A4C1XMT1_EUMVA|nr:hypothetical protein EVAR_61299_1 [Eumeta japonica]